MKYRKLDLVWDCVTYEYIIWNTHKPISLFATKWCVSFLFHFEFVWFFDLQSKNTLVKYLQRIFYVGTKIFSVRKVNVMDHSRLLLISSAFPTMSVSESNIWISAEIMMDIDWMIIEIKLIVFLVFLRR